MYPAPPPPRPNAIDGPLMKDTTTSAPNRFFIGANHTVTLAQIGATATLNCEVIDIEENTVSGFYTVLFTKSKLYSLPALILQISSFFIFEIIKSEQ